MELFTGLGWKAWGVVVIAVVLFGFAARYEYLAHEVKQQQTTITEQTVEIKTKDEAIKVDKVVNAIDNTAQVKVQEEVHTAVVKHQVIAEKVDQKEHQINRNFGMLPKTAANIQAEQQQLSEARIDGLWEAYCVSQPDDTECSTVAQGDHHA